MTSVLSEIIPNRVSNLVALKTHGANVTCKTSFAVANVEFRHKPMPYEAYVFMCYFRGEVDGSPYEFRKCYARGCLHNLCPHISQAVMIANRYLQRDYKILEDGGIPVDEKLFTLEEMTLKSEDHTEERALSLTIEDCIAMAEEGDEVRVAVEPEFVDAVEHFGGAKESQVFLTATFTVEARGKTHIIQRCLCCYEPKNLSILRAGRIFVANARLEEIYRSFEAAGVHYNKALFS